MRDIELCDLGDIIPRDPLIREAAAQQMILRIGTINRNFKAIFQEGWADVTPLEEYVATGECRYDREEVAAMIDGPEFRQRIRGLVAQKIAQARAAPTPPPAAETSEEEEEEEVAVRSRRSKPKPKAKGGRTRGVDRNGVPEGVTRAEWAKFPEWKKDIYLKREENPNAFHYRFVAPGEERHRGAWTAAEERHFIEQMEGQTSDGHFAGQWGLFAILIPGRVGYECRNFYDRLVKRGVFEDDRYGADMKVMKKSEREGGATVGRTRRTPITRRRAPEPEPEPELDPEANPFAKQLDPITLEPMWKPMASPGGVVLNKDTWTSMYREGNIATCPYTRVDVKRRDLEPVTWENFEEWAPKLKNWVVDENGEVSPPDEAPPEVVLE